MTYGPGLALVAGALFTALEAGFALDAGFALNDDAQDTGEVARYEALPAHLRPVLEQDVVDGCLACHRDSLSLAEAEVEALAEAIAAIIRNEANHIVPIAGLSDEDLMALVEALADPDDTE